ncbi:MAG TPA: O-methyltransferase [Bacteroidales bacterium]|jgi:predicted O-methyltransferase YrrM|nr:O-methyltransferase [Bacteroidales bacterium]HNZ43266.1 O-methyltransferase [Bacteroidales bacterium]HPB25914.1 O-methyltransferase [Bacteroidales bacterium]HPI29836.1 O-methyltransferase [Bacteroidales bacterium]HQN15124.1 O-methyltransferase [Bacteroidales bacterium]
MNPTDPKIIEYAEQISKPESPLLNRIFRETNLKVMNPIMLSGHLQGKFLSLLSRMIKPLFALEVGTYTAYSALCIAQGLQPDGKLFTIESNPELEDICRKNIMDSGLHHKIELLMGDARELIKGLPQSFDMVFIDFDKEIYLDIYKLVFEKLNPGGYIIADNVLWHGKILDEEEQNYRGTQSLAAFNEYVRNDERADNLLLPFRDGLMIIQKL